MLISRNRFPIICLILLAFTTSILLTMQSTNNAVSIVLSMLMFNIYVGSAPEKRRDVFFFFNLTFFTFLVGLILVDWINGQTVLGKYTEEIRTSTIMALCVSLICILIGQFLSENFSFRRNVVLVEEEQIDVDEYLRKYGNILKITYIVFYITFPFLFLDTLDRASYVIDNSYTALYVAFQSKMPYILVKLGELNTIVFALLCCTEIRKEKIKLPCALFLVFSVLSLAIGKRNVFVLNIIMFIVAMRFMNNKMRKSTGDVLYTSRIIWIAAVALPIMIVVLEMIGNTRDLGYSHAYSSQGMLNSIESFFYKQGGQITFLSDTIQQKPVIDKPLVPFTFSSVYNYFRNLFGLTNYKMYTLDYIKYGNYLGASLTQIVSPGTILSGKGSGCCYIAELYYDWGFAGIVIGCIVLGYILGRLKISDAREPWFNAFILLMIRWIVYIPRSSYLDWISYPLNIWNIVIVIAIVMADRVIKRRAVR